MWFHASLTVPAGTAETSPVEVELKLTHGVIKYLGVGFPTGCKQLVKVRLYHCEHQIFPANSDEPAAWNGGIEGGAYHYRLVEAPYLLTARGYSPSTTKSHTVTILVNLIPVEAAESWVALGDVMDQIKGVFGLR